MERMPTINPKDQVYTLRMDKKLSEQFKELANRKNMKPSRLIRELIRAELQKDLPPEPPKPVGRPRKQISELKDSVRRISQDRADLELIKQLKSISERVERYQKALSEEVGRYILEEHRKGHLKLFKASKEGDYFTESDLAKTIEKLIDDF